MTDSDRDLLESFSRLQRRSSSFALQVGRVTWPTQHEPTVLWQTWRAYPAEPTTEQLEADRAELLADRRYFLRCSRCGERCNIGHMHDDDTCQSCAERYRGVVH